MPLPGSRQRSGLYQPRSQHTCFDAYLVSRTHRATVATKQSGDPQILRSTYNFGALAGRFTDAPVNRRTAVGQVYVYMYVCLA